MSQLVGLVTATPGTITKVGMSASTVNIAIKNDSFFDAWIKIGGAAPALAPGPTTLGLWDHGITAGAREPYTLPLNFDGVVWVGIYDPGGNAATGVTSSRANVYVTAYAAGEDPGQAYGAPRLADLSSQPRIVDIPIAAGMTVSSTYNPPASGNTFAVPFQAGAGGGGVQVQVTGGQVYVVYVHYWLLWLAQNITGQANYQLVVQELNNVSAVVATNALLWATAAANATNGTNDRHSFQPSRPAAFIFTAQATAILLQLGIASGGQTGVVNPTGYAIGWDVDTSANAVIIPGIGGGFAGRVNLLSELTYSGQQTSKIW